MTTERDQGKAAMLARTALAFGRIERATRHEDGVRPETDTDHTVMLGLIAGELAPPGLDRGLVAAFALVHDLPEVYAGDAQTLVISPEALAAKYAREAAARTRLGDELGEGSWLAGLLVRYEQQREPEARFVRLLDKVLPKLLHAFNGCAAALPLTDHAGLVASHAEQLQRLRAEYTEFPEALDLLRATMLYAENCWGRCAAVSTAEDAAARRAMGAGDRCLLHTGHARAEHMYPLHLRTKEHPDGRGW